MLPHLHWLSVQEASERLDVRTNTIYNYVRDGRLRAWTPQGTPGAGLLVFTPDVQALIEHRQARGPRVKPQTLVERGIFPDVLTGLSGTQLVEWALMEGRIDLISTGEPPGSMLEEPFGRRQALSEKTEETATLSARVDALTQLVQCALIAQGQMASPQRLDPEGCVQLLRKCLHGLMQPFTQTHEFQPWLDLAASTAEHHVLSLSRWAEQNPAAFKSLCPDDVVPYGPLARLVDLMWARAQLLPGRDLAGSMPYQVWVQARRCLDHIGYLCRVQLASDLVHHPALPSTPVYSATDRYILARLNPQRRPTGPP